MRYLTDYEILKWNKRLNDNHYFVRPCYLNNSNYPSLAIYKEELGNLIEVKDPDMQWYMTFSIVKSRKKIFFDLFEKFTKDTIGNKTIVRSDEVEYRDIKFDESIVKSKEESIHKVFNREYIKYTYHFSGKLSSIILYILLLEDSIGFLQEMWGYDEDGKEINLLKYPIGTFVSCIGDTSRDYLVVDYDFLKTTDNYKINLVVSEVLEITSTIHYGAISIFEESQLCYSRNCRINDILN